MMDIVLVSGFLGAGKTTLIRHLLTSRTERFGKVAVIVNEVGEIGVDGALLSGRDVDILELTSGCICCTIKTDFSRAVQEIHDRIRPDFLVVEATGVAQPGDMLDVLFDPPLSEFSRLKSLVTVVDADFLKARELLGSFYDNQIRSADTLILNKTDLVEERALQEMEALLRQLNPRSMIFTTRYCAVDPSQLFWGGPGDRQEHPHDHNGLEDHHELGFQNFSFEDERPMDRGRLDQFLKALPPTLFRCKGWIRFPDNSALLDFTGGRYQIVPAGSSRPNALSFVGRNCDENEILHALEECLIKQPTKE